MPQWTTTSQTNAANGVKVLVYGGAGEGKTSLCATAPRPVILSAESGLLSLTRKNIERMYGVNTPGISYDIPVMQVTTIEQLMEAYSYFAQPNNRASEHFSTICMDSASEVAEVVLANAKRQVKDPRQAYGELVEKMLDTIRKFRDLAGFNVYVTAKQAYDKDEVTGVFKYQPAMPGKQLGPALPYLFDEVFCLRTSIPKSTTEKGYRFFQTQPDFQYTAKDRSGALDEIERPDLTHIFNKIQQG